MHTDWAPSVRRQQAACGEAGLESGLATELPMFELETVLVPFDAYQWPEFWTLPLTSHGNEQSKIQRTLSKDSEDLGECGPSCCTSLDPNFFISEGRRKS